MCIIFLDPDEVIKFRKALKLFNLSKALLIDFKPMPNEERRLDKLSQDAFLVPISPVFIAMGTFYHQFISNNMHCYFKSDKHFLGLQVGGYYKRVKAQFEVKATKVLFYG